MNGSSRIALVFLCLPLLVCAVVVSAGFSAEAEPVEDQDQADLLLRKIYVPSSSPAKWPTEGRAFLPIDADRLEELLETATRQAASRARPTVTRAVLYASVDSSHLLVGHGTLEIAKPLLPTEWLRFEPGRLQLTRFHWRTSEAPAELGYWGRAGELALRVAKEGAFDFDWRLPARIQPSNQRAYELVLPAALSTTLIVDLPEGEPPEPIDRLTTWATQADERLLQEAVRHLGAAPIPELPSGATRWVLSCGPASRLAWRVGRTAKTASGLAPSMSERLDYKIAPSGLSLRQRLEIGMAGALPETIALAAPEGLVLTNARWDGEPIPWTYDSTAQTYHVACPVSDPVTQSPVTQRTKHELELEAWCPVELATLWRLPQFTTRDLFWSEGRLDVEMVGLLRVEDLALRGMHQVLPPADAGPRLSRFQKTRSNARLQLQISRQLPRTTLAQGTVVRLRSVGSQATIVAQVEPVDGARIQVLRANVLDSWEIQSVDSFLPDAVNSAAIDDWYLLEDAPGERQLTIRLSAHSPEAASVVLTIRAERQASAMEEWLPINDNVALEWLDATMEENLISLESEEGFQIDFSPLPVALPIDQLLPHLGSLLPASPQGEVFDLRETGNVNLHLSPEGATFDCDVIVEVVDDLDEQGEAIWRHACRIICTPQRRIVDRLALSLPPESQPPLRWKLEGEDDWRNATQQFDIARAVGGVWELLLPQPRSDRFAVILDWGVSRDSTFSAWPPTVLGAKSQSTQFRIHTISPRQIALEATGLVLLTSAPLSPADREPQEGMRLHSAWLAPSGDLPIRVARVAQEGIPPRARIGSATLESTYAPSAPSRHRYRFSVDNDAESELRCQLPKSATSIRWYRVEASSGQVGSGSDGSVDPQSNSPEKNSPPKKTTPRQTTFAIPLLHESKGGDYFIEFALPEKPLDGMTHSAPWPRLSLPVEVGDWHLSIPKELGATSPQLPPVEATWQGRLFGPLARAVGEPRASGRLSSTGPFHSFRLSSAGAEPLSVTFFDVPRRQARYQVVLVLSLAVGYGLGRWPKVFVAALALAAAATLLVPPGWIGWASACFWGGLASGLFRGLQAAWKKPEAPSERLAESPARPLKAGTQLLLLAVWLSAAPEPVHAEGQERSPIESVLIPVDAEGRPAGEPFLTPRLLRELLQREQRAQSERDWMIASALYEGRVESPDESASDTPSFSSSDWRFTFDLQTFRREVTVELPLEEVEAQWNRTLTLDGLPTKLTWADGGSGCRFRVHEPGRYQVSLVGRPKIESVDTHCMIRLRVPPLPRAELKITGSAQVEGLEFLGPGWRADKSADESQEEPRSVAVDSHSELVLRWNRSPSEDHPRHGQLEQWEWMQISPGPLHVDYLLRLRGTEKNLPPVEILSSERAKMVLLPSTGSPAPEAIEQAEWRNAWMIATLPEADDSGAPTLVARFRLILDRTEPSGRIRFPHVTLRGMPTAHRKQAVSHPQDLAVAIASSSAPVTDVEVDEFVSNWPDRSLPDWAVAADSEASPLVISVLPVVEATSPDERLQVGCFASQLVVRYQGDYPRSVSSRFRQELRVSPDLRIDSVAMHLNGPTVPVRTSRPQPDRLVVFFSESVTRPFRLSVEARRVLPAATKEARQMTLPSITSWRNRPATQRLFLFSAPHLAARFGGENLPTRLADLPMVVPKEWHVYGEGAFQVSEVVEEPPTLVLQENHPRFDAALVTTLAGTPGNWVAELGLALDVAQGTLSEVLLDLPPTLSGGLEVDPPVYVEEVPRAEGQPQQLKLRFPQAVRAGENFRVTLRCSLRPSDPRQFRLPRLGIRHANVVRRYFGMLPSHDGTWTWTAAAPAAAPAAIESFLVAWPNAQLLATQGKQHAIVRWTAHERNDRTLQLPLVEVQANLSPGGVATLRTCLAIPAMDKQQLQVVLPDSCRLLSARVDGSSAVVQASAKGGLRLSLPGKHLPHVVELVTVTEQPLPGSGSLHLQAPGLMTGDGLLKPEHFLWSVVDLRAGDVLQGESAEGLPQVDRAALRLNQLLQVATMETNGLPIEGADELVESQAAGAACWAEVLDGAAAELRRALRAVPPLEQALVEPTTATQEFDDLLARGEKRIERLRKQGSAGVARENLHAWIHPLQSDSPSGGDDKRGEGLLAVTGEPWLHLTLSPQAPTDRPARWGLAVAILLFVSVFLRTSRSERLRAIDPVWLFPATAIAGLAGWLWLSPSWVGPLFMAAALLAWLRSARHPS